MKKFKKDTKVFSYHFNYDTAELICDELTVVNYSYMDGMQWNIIDEYTLVKEYEEPKFWFFKKKKYKYVRLPGHMISDDKMKAKVKILKICLDKFSYRDDSLMNPSLRKLVDYASEEYHKIEKQYPEILVKVAGDAYLCEEDNYTIWR